MERTSHLQKIVAVRNELGILLPPTMLEKLDPNGIGKVGWKWVGERTLMLRPAPGDPALT